MRQNAKNTYLQSPHTFAEKVRHTTGCEDIVIIDKAEKDKDRRDSVAKNNEQAILEFNWEPYLNVNLFKEEQNEIINRLDLLHSNGIKLKMPSIIDILQNNGYTVTSRFIKNPKTKKRNRCILITKD